MSPRIFSAALLAGLAFPIHDSVASDEGGIKLLKTDSRSPYVHRISLYDHDGRIIDPTDEFAGPFSVAMTCGKCHPYGQISGGWHFNASNPEIPPGRPGEPWFLIDQASETVLPISGRGWPGVFQPADAGLDNWKFVKRFGRHLPGGGFGSPSKDEIAKSAQAARWGVSGALEVDCQICHAADMRHDPSEAERQIAAENFQWLPTVAYGLASIRGEARKAPDDWDPLMPPNPDRPEEAGPKLLWDLNKFDPDNRVIFDLVRQPSANRCYFCHSFRVIDDGAHADLLTTRDVHLAAGLTCAECHRNELDHAIVRGYAAEAAERSSPIAAAFTCEGCHLGAVSAQPAARLGGLYGAPRPEHRGLPPLHFEKLACTACHAGPWPEMETQRFQTALAHGLGLSTRDREAEDLPEIVGPVFARQSDGKIVPQRLVWPSYWGFLEGEHVRLIEPDVVNKKIKQTKIERIKAGTQRRYVPLAEEQIHQLLQSFEEEYPDAEAVFRVRNGVTIARNKDGRVENHPYKPPPTKGDGPAAADSTGSDSADPLAALAEPYRWSIAHDVRPASQSMGIRGCEDCHSDGAPMYFGKIAWKGDPHSDARPIQYMYELRGDDPKFARLWNLGFVYRPAFKWFGFMCAGVLALILLQYALQALGALSRRYGR